MAAAKKTPEDATVPDESRYAEEFAAEEVWAYEPAGPSLLARSIAEGVGAFALVLIGVGAALISAGGMALAVGFAFGLVILAGAITVGHVSGAHFNPAITIGAWIAGRIRGAAVLPYLLAQLVGAVLGAAVLVAIYSGHPQVPSVREFMSGGAMGFGDHSPTGFGMIPAVIVEAVGMALLVAIVLAATSVRAPKGLAPFAIGLAFVATITWAVPITNAGLNPARATASAVFSEPWALQQLWVFWVAPLVGAIVVGLLFRAFSSDEDFEVVEVVETIED
jgi:aquaporin Z